MCLTDKVTIPIRPQLSLRMTNYFFIIDSSPALSQKAEHDLSMKWMKMLMMMMILMMMMLMLILMMIMMMIIVVVVVTTPRTSA